MESLLGFIFIALFVTLGWAPNYTTILVLLFIVVGWLVLLRDRKKLLVAAEVYLRTMVFLLPILLLALWVIVASLGARYVWATPRVSFREAFLASRWLGFVILALPIVNLVKPRLRFLALSLLVWLSFAGAFSVLRLALRQWDFSLVPPELAISINAAWPMTLTPYVLALQTIFVSGLVLFQQHWWPKNRLLRVLIGMSLGLSYVAVALCMTRGVWLSFSVGLVLLLTLYRWRLAVGGVVLGILVLVAVSAGSDVARLRLLGPPQQGLSPSQKTRLELWKSNLLIFRDNPIFGVGMGQSIKHVDRYNEHRGGPISLAHSNYFEFLSDLGAFGLIVFAFMVGSLFQAAWILYWQNNSDLARAVGAGALASFAVFNFGGLTESTAFEEAVALCFALIAMLVLAYFPMEKKLETRIEA